MEVVENKSKYVRRESRKEKFLRIFGKLFWLYPLLTIAIGLFVAWQLIRKIQSENISLPEVNYEELLKPAEKPTKEVKKLDLYREKMKKEKEEKITSRYEKIISGREIVGKVDYGKVVPPPDSPEERKAEVPPSSAPGQESIPEVPEVVPDAPLAKKSPDLPERQNDPQRAPSPGRKGEKKAAKETPSDLPSEPADSLSKVAEAIVAPDPFHTLKSQDSATTRYTRAHFYGDQDILSGAFIRLRLGEDMLFKGKLIPRNTVFRGTASVAQNKIEIRIEQIGHQEIAAMVCDKDFQPGIVIPASTRDGMNEEINRSLYQSGIGNAMDLPYEILQDVSQSILRHRRRKQSTIRINDGYLVYITQTLH